MPNPERKTNARRDTRHFGSIMVVGSLVLIWAMFILYVRSDHYKTNEMFFERQRTVLLVGSDVLDMLQDQVGPFSSLLFDTSFRAMLSNGDMIDKYLAQNKYYKKNLAGYGDIIVLDGQTPIYYHGAIKNFIRRKGMNTAVDPALRAYFRDADEHLLKMTSALIYCKSLRVGDRTLLLSAGQRRFMSGRINLVLYADEATVLKTSGFYERRGKVLAAALFSSAIILLFGGLLTSSIRRDDRRREELEEAVRSRETAERDMEKFRSATESANIGIVLADMNGILVYMNDKMARMHGCSPDELLGRHLSVLHAPDKMDRVNELVARLRAEGGFNTEEVWHIRKDGMEFPTLMSATIMRDASGRPEYMSASADDITEIREVEAARRESEEKYRALVETTDTGYIILDETGGIVDANAEYLRLAGRASLDEILGRRVTEWTAPYDAERNRLEVEKCIKTGSVKNLEIDYIHPDGKIIPVLINARVVDALKGFRIISLVQDITERRAAQDAVKKQLVFSQNIIDTIPSPVFYKNPDGVYLGCNRAFEEFIGLSRGDIIGKTVYDISRKEVADINWKADLELLEHRDPIDYETQIRHVDGALRDVIFRKSLFFNADGEIGGIIGVMLDITDRKNMETDLRNSEEKVRTILNSPNLVSFLLDLDGVVLEINETAAKSIGRSRDDLLGKPILEAFDSDTAERRREMFFRAVNEKQTIHYQDTRAGKVFDAFMRPVLDERGDVRQVAIISTDITEQARAREEKERLTDQLNHSQKMEAIGRLAGGVAHDFNNILAVMIGNAELALRNKENPDKQEKSLRKIVESGAIAKDLTMKLLSFGRRERIDVRAVSVVKIVHDLVDMLERSIPKHVRIAFQEPSEAPYISVDYNQFIQALLNICINSSDSMPDGGTLSIAIENITIDNEPELNAGPHCVIRVGDTGAGIPEEIRDKIFEPFFTTKEKGKGTGLGLFVTLGIIRNHKGRLDIKNAPGGGTIVEIILPVSAESPHENAESEMAPRPPRDSAAVLVIDDDPEYLNMIIEMLSAEGYRPLPAPSGKSGVEMFRRRHGKIDLVLLDMMMPDVDGAAVYEELRAIQPDVKVILCSGYSKEGKVGEAMRQGVKAFIQKPFSIRRLNEAIFKALSD